MATLQAYHIDCLNGDGARLDVAFGTYQGKPGISVATRDFDTAGTLVYLSVDDATRLRDTLDRFIVLATPLAAASAYGQSG